MAEAQKKYLFVVWGEFPFSVADAARWMSSDLVDSINQDQARIDIGQALKNLPELVNLLATVNVGGSYKIKVHNLSVSQLKQIALFRADESSILQDMQIKSGVESKTSGNIEITVESRYFELLSVDLVGFGPQAKERLKRFEKLLTIINGEKEQ